MIKHVVSYSQFLLPSCYPVEYAVTRFNARSRMQNGLGLFPNAAYMDAQRPPGYTFGRSTRKECTVALARGKNASKIHHPWRRVGSSEAQRGGCVRLREPGGEPASGRPGVYRGGLRCHFRRRLLVELSTRARRHLLKTTPEKRFSRCGLITWG